MKSFPHTFANYFLSISDVVHQPMILLILKCLCLIKYATLPETSSRGDLIPEMIQLCDYDILIVLVELNRLI